MNDECHLLPSEFRRSGTTEVATQLVGGKEKDDGDGRMKMLLCGAD